MRNIIVVGNDGSVLYSRGFEVHEQFVVQFTAKPPYGISDVPSVKSRRGRTPSGNPLVAHKVYPPAIPLRPVSNRSDDPCGDGFMWVRVTSTFVINQVPAIRAAVSTGVVNDPRARECSCETGFTHDQPRMEAYPPSARHAP
jgi:hypothetical protein